MAITPEIYQHEKKKLLQLLAKATELPDLLPETTQEIEQARKKLLEDQFEIVLVGEFQGGKSTTFNNFCDAREISPRGKGGGGIKTSGCIVRARNLSDPKEEEYARVTWRTPEELLLGFDAVLRSKVRSDQFDRAEKKAPSGGGEDRETKDESDSEADERSIFELFSLENPEGRQKIRKAAEAQIRIWEADRAGYDSEDLGLIDLIRFALVAATYFSDSTITKYRKRERFSLNEIHQLLTFPEEWQTRWEAWNPKVFQPEELLFAFVAEVECYIHSPNLERLGCVITDCPGLFASAWDTSVADKAVARADAVLYLITGDKQLAQSNLKAIKALPAARGLIFVGANCRTQSWVNAEKILRSNISLLKTQGLDITEKDIRLYHSLLALYSNQLGRGIETLDFLTLEELRKDFGLPEPPDPSVMTKRMRRKTEQFRETLDPAVDVDDELSPEESRLPQLFTAVEQFIVSRKAFTVLQGNGKRVGTALNQAEIRLKSQEESATKKKETREQEKVEAEEALRVFEERTNKEIEKIGEYMPEKVAASFGSKLRSEESEFTKQVAEKVTERYKEKFSLLGVFKIGSILRELTSVVERELNDWLRLQRANWIAELRQGKNEQYQATMTTPMEQFHCTLESEWEKVKEKRIPLLSGITLPHDAEIDINSSVNLPPGFVDTIQAIIRDSINKQTWRFLGIGIIGIIVAVIIIPLLPAIFSIGALGAAMRFCCIAPESWNKMEENIKQSIGSGRDKRLTKGISEHFETIVKPIETELRGSLEKVVESRRKFLQEQVNYPRKVYESQYQKAMGDYELAESELIATAEKAKKIRKEKIEPLSRTLSDFLSELERKYSEDQPDKNLAHR